MKIAIANEARTRQLDVAALIGLGLGPALLAAVLLLPTSLTPPQHHLLALILFTMAFWVFRVLPLAVTGLLALALAVVLDVAPRREVFGAFSSPTLFMLIGSFIITQAMMKYGLGHRVALNVLSIPGVAKSTYRIAIAFGALATLLSSVLDNGAVAAMLLPIAMGLVKTFSEEMRAEGSAPKNANTPLRFCTALMLMLAYGSTVGALITPFGDASVIVGWHFIRQQFGITLSVGTWMALAAPIVTALFAVLSVTVLLVNRPEVRRIPDALKHVRQRRNELGPMSQGEINTAIVFCLAVFFWLLPSIVAMIDGYHTALYVYLSERLPPSAVAVLAATLLFLLPVTRRGGITLRWKDTTRMDWAPVLMVGSALALGKLMVSTGLASVMGEALAEQATGLSATGVYFFSAATAILFSELTTNLVSVSVLAPMLPPLALASNAVPLEASMVATFAAVYGFMLPISTSANAIVYASGQVPFWKMVTTGFLVDLSGVVIVVVGLHIMLRLLGLT